MPGSFTIQITGEIVKPGDQTVLINILRPRIDKFATDYEIDIYGFLRKSYRIEVKGVPLHFDYVDNLLASIKLHVVKYLRYWTFKIEIDLIERG